MIGSVHREVAVDPGVFSVLITILLAVGAGRGSRGATPASTSA
jgi:hypothetical protein